MTAAINGSVGYTPGGCNDSTSRQFTQEVKLDWPLAPDPKVNSDTEWESGSSFSIHTYTCGPSDTYYSRAYFNASPSYVDSAHQTEPSTPCK